MVVLLDTHKKDPQSWKEPYGYGPKYMVDSLLETKVLQAFSATGWSGSELHMDGASKTGKLNIERMNLGDRSLRLARSCGSWRDLVLEVRDSHRQ